MQSCNICLQVKLGILQVLPLKSYYIVAHDNNMAIFRLIYCEKNSQAGEDYSHIVGVILSNGLYSQCFLWHEI